MHSSLVDAYRFVALVKKKICSIPGISVLWHIYLIRISVQCFIYLGREHA